MRVLILFFLLSSIALLTQAQDKTALQYANRLDSLKMRVTLAKLTSVEMAGRKSNEKGCQLAAGYLIEQLKKNKFKVARNGSYKQSIEAFHRDKSNKYFKLADFNYNACYSYSNSTFLDSVIAGNEIVFAGYGIYHSTFNDFANIDIKDKIVMVIKGNGPVNKYGVPCHKASYIPNLEYIASQKPKAVLKVKLGFDNFSNYGSKKLNFYSTEESSGLPVVEINEILANRILEPSGKTIKQWLFECESNCSSASFEFKNELLFNGNYSYQLADVNNIVGIIEGSDLKDEYVVLSAHYDHIGTSYGGRIYYGADDNASGVSAALEIARVLNEAKKAGKGPRRSVVVLFPTAEEDGLYGSKYYTEKPIYPLEKTIACVNIDMLGRIGSKVEAKDVEKGYVYALTGPSKVNKVLFGIMDSINSLTTKISVLSKDGNSYGSSFRYSDHYSFYKKNIPSIMFTNGRHEDLHQTTDVIEKINFPSMLQRSKLVFLTLWDLANNPKPYKELLAKPE